MEDLFDEQEKLIMQDIRRQGFTPPSETHYLTDLYRDLNDVARAKNCSVVFPEPNQIQLDIDSYDRLQVYRGMFAAMGDFISIPEPEFQSSKSGGSHYHVTVTFPVDLNEWQRIALQAILGSDPMRELLNALRLMLRGKSESCLFVPNQKHLPLLRDPYDGKGHINECDWVNTGGISPCNCLGAEPKKEEDQLCFLF